MTETLIKPPGIRPDTVAHEPWRSAESDRSEDWVFAKHSRSPV